MSQQRQIDALIRQLSEYKALARKLKRDLEYHQGKAQEHWQSIKPGIRVSAIELKTIELVCHGLSNNEIAERMYVAEKTVRARLTQIYKKVGTSRRTLLVRLWLARTDADSL